MKRGRTFIAFLLTLALPFAAVASIGEGFRCHHAGIGAPAADAMPAQHDHAAAMQHDRIAMAHAHHAAADLTSHDNCDCPVKCDCAQHCAGTACGAVVPLHPLELASACDAAIPMAGYVGLIRDAWHSPAFRPPIATLPSAA